MISNPDSARWFIPLRRAAESRFRLLCFPYAGGTGTAFRELARALPADIDVWAVALPGRAQRIREAPYRRLSPLVESLTECLAADRHIRSVFFGHSLGALTAYEVASRLQATGERGPESLLVSGHPAPHLPHRHPLRYTLGDGDLVTEIRRFGGVPEELLSTPEILSLLLPTFRSDLEVVETYEHIPRGPLLCPVTAFGGDADPMVTEAELAAWRELTQGSFTYRTFPGDHFYLLRSLPALTAEISRALQAVAP